MRTLIVGAGSVGGFLGGHLAAKGAEVTFLVRGDRADALRRTGLFIRSPLGDVRTAVVATSDATQASPPDVVVLACKAYSLDSALDAIEPVVHRGTAVLPILNGLAHLDRISARFPGAVVWGGLAHFSAAIAADGAIQHLNTLSFLRLGPRGQQIDHRAAAFASLFTGSTVEASVSSRIEQDMWDKFVFVATLAGITCLMRASVGTVVSTSKGARIIESMLEECTAVAAAAGYPPGPQDLSAYRAQLLQPASTSKASMLRDIEANRPTEGAHLLGDMVARGARASIATPLLEVAWTHLQAYESLRSVAA